MQMQHQRQAMMGRRAAALAMPAAAARPRSSVAVASSSSSATLIDGKKVAETLRGEIKAEVQQLQAQHKLTPGLAVVLVGTRKDSQAYVKSKKTACAEVGINSYGTDLDENASEEAVLKVGGLHGRSGRKVPCE